MGTLYPMALLWNSNLLHHSILIKILRLVFIKNTAVKNN